MLTSQQRSDLLGVINACLNTDLNEGDIPYDALLIAAAATATRLRDLEAKYNGLVPSQAADKI